MIRTHRYASKFRSDYKRELRGHHGRKLDEWLDDAVSLLLRDERLPKKYRDHELVVDWKGYRDCHLAPDLLLIYRKLPGVLLLARLGSHSEIFG